MKLSKLLKDSYILSAHIQGFLEHLKGRCTGYTTGECLEIIGKVMQNPEKVYKVINERPFSRNIKLEVIESLIKRLELQHFKISYCKQEIVYNPYGDVDVKVETLVKWNEE
jgi:hypothetical protein